MVNSRTVKLGLAGAVVLVVVIVAGQVLQLVSWVLSWVLLAAVVIAAGYAAYELYSGWKAAAEDHRRDAGERAGVAARTGSVDRPRERHVEEQLDEEAFEADLDGSLAAEEADRERE